MKTAAHLEIPKRREILVVQRMKQEQLNAQKEKLETKREERVHRQKKRKQFLLSPPMRLASRMGGFLWALLVSLILTLIACYLVMNPHVLETFSRPIEQFFSVSIAGAAPVEELMSSRSKNAKTLNSATLPKTKVNMLELEAEILVERVLSPNYLGKEDEVRKLLGEIRPYASRGFSGVLPLTKLRLDPTVGLMRKRVDRVIEFDQLPTNDVSQLPAEQTFTLRSSEKVGAQKEVSLRAAEWRWEIEEFDTFGLPSRYKAFVTYRGEEVWLDYVSLKARAYYAATLSRELPPATLPLPKPEVSNPTTGGSGRPRSSGSRTRAVTRPHLDSGQFATLAGESAQETTTSEVTVQADQGLQSGFVPVVTPVSETRAAQRQSILPLPLALGLSAATVAAGSVAAVVYYRRKKRQDAEE